MAFRLFSCPQRGHLIAKREKSASASFLLHLLHLTSITDMPLACRLWLAVCTVAVPWPNAGINCGRWPLRVFPHSQRSHRLFTAHTG